METAAIAPPAPVELSFEGPRPQRRATVAFRIILIFPHLLFAGALGAVAEIIAVVAWFAALFTGRTPDGIGDFLGQILQYSTRVYAYGYLMTDQYPPFDLGAPDYAVNVSLPARGRLNRAAVFFRFVLAVPVGLLMTLVLFGMQIPMVIIWLIVLISGRMPSSVFEAEATILRYQARFYAWMGMLTSQYPGGLFGDPPLSPSPTPAHAFGITPPTSPGPVPPLPPPPSPPAAPAPMAAPPPPGYGLPPVEPLPALPRVTRLVLSRGAKRLLVLFIVLGSLLYVAEIVAIVVLAGQNDESVRSLDRDYATFVTASRQYGVAIQGCGLTGGVDCVHTADRDLATATHQFAIDLANDDFPGEALDQADTLRDDATKLSGILDRMAATSDVALYKSYVSQFQTTGSKLDQDYRDLHDLLELGD